MASPSLVGTLHDKKQIIKPVGSESDSLACLFKIYGNLTPMFSMCSTRGHVKSHFLSKRRFFKNNLTQHCTAAPSRITFCISSPPSAVRPSADSAGRLRVRRSAQPRRVTSHPSRPQDNSSPGRQTPSRPLDDKRHRRAPSWCCGGAASPTEVGDAPSASSRLVQRAWAAGR